GNGRHGRLFVDTLLVARRRAPFSWGGDTARLQQVGDVRSTYIKALRSADRGDFQPLLAFVRQ
ncbi:MAG: mobile mystery protein B, partial [Gemmatimonadaceae bacterium]